jgi:PTH1 family peptidyl-tRNA hydrolase
MTDSSHPYLFVGLGNPGATYEHTRHNIGFRVLDALADAYHGPGWQIQCKGLMTTLTWPGGEKIRLLKPQTFMNLSGISVQQALSFYKIPLQNLLVIHDDIDLAPFVVRGKKGGSDAGHRGLISITTHVSSAYERLRLGVGRPVHADAVSTYVLSRFSPDEEKNVDLLCKAITKIIELWPTQRIEFATSLRKTLEKEGFSPS